MPWKLCGYGLQETAERPGQLTSSLRTSTERAAKGDVRPIAAQRARLAVVIITIFDNAPMDAKYHFCRDRRICGKSANPSVSIRGGS